MEEDKKAFENAIALSVSEVCAVLKQKKERSGNKFDPVFEKTYEYVERFNHFPNNKAGNEAVMLIRDNMRQTLTEFESASLVSLCPQSKEEAKALIPDLAKYDDDILEDFIEYLNNQTNTHQILLYKIFKLNIDYNHAFRTCIDAMKQESFSLKNKNKSLELFPEFYDFNAIWTV